MAVDQQDKYLNEANKANQDIYNDFKLKKYRASTQIPLGSCSDYMPGFKAINWK